MEKTIEELSKEGGEVIMNTLADADSLLEWLKEIKPRCVSAVALEELFALSTLKHCSAAKAVEMTFDLIIGAMECEAKEKATFLNK